MKKKTTTTTDAPQTIRLSVTLTADEVAAADRRAAEIGLNRSQYLGHLIRADLPKAERVAMPTRREAHRPPAT